MSDPVKHTRAYLEERVSELEAKLREAREVLRLVEPHLTTCRHPARCPCCKREFTTFGHAPDCRLAAQLKEP